MNSRQSSVSYKFLPWMMRGMELFRQQECIYSGQPQDAKQGRLNLRDDTDSPQIDFLAMALALFQDFRSQVVGSAAHGGSSLGVHILSTDRQGSEAKVADLDVHLLVQE